MDINFLGKGIIIGLSIAVPVGPIGVLCINRILAQGRISGLVSGLGAATADAIYSCISGFWFTFISNTLISQQVYFRLIGGLFLYPHSLPNPHLSFLFFLYYSSTFLCHSCEGGCVIMLMKILKKCQK